MLSVAPSLDASRPLRLLCIGAHSDDLEIGCGGTLLTWLEAVPTVEITWVVLTGDGARVVEAKRSARALLRRARTDIVLGGFTDGFLPAQYREVKELFESLKNRCEPDVVLTHALQDRHQDHRLAGELTWNTWRDHMILEYEIPKYEGDLDRPNVFVPVVKRLMRRKVAHLTRYFGSQHSKGWFSGDNFLAVARIRGLESRSPSGFAEAFHARKLNLQLGA
jgi:LmbE family N-acetylglucosaminyl deacetylase